MRLTTTLDHLGVHRHHHHKGQKNSVVFIEAPREHHHDTRTGQQRWRATSYRDPWPDRA